MSNEKPIVVGHLRDSDGLYGAEQVILTLAKNIDRKRFTMLLVCLDHGGNRSTPLIEAGKSIDLETILIAVHAKIDRTALRRIRSLLAERSVSMIHSHDYKSDWYGYWATRKTPTRRVTTSHGSTKDSFMLRAYLNMTEHLVYPHFDAVIAVSDQRQKDLSRIRGVSKKLVCIHNSLDNEYFSDKSNVQCLQTEKKRRHSFTIGIVGRLTPDKGHRILFSALPEIKQRFADVRVMIAGDGPAREYLKKLCTQYYLNDTVCFCGVRRDMKAVYRELDLVVIPSFREGLPYVLLEAIGCHIPVIASEVGGIPQVIEHGVTGLLVQPANSGALAQAVIRSLSDRHEAQRMAQRAFDLVKSEYSCETMVHKIEELYLRIANKQLPHGLTG